MNIGQLWSDATSSNGEQANKEEDVIMCVVAEDQVSNGESDGLIGSLCVNLCVNLCDLLLKICS